MTTRSRSGTSLIEAVVFSLIALAAVVALFVIYRDAQREMAKTNVHLRGLQATHMLLERVRLDLKGAVTFDTSSGTEGVRAPAPTVLELYHHQPDPAAGQPVPPDGPSGLTLLKVPQVRYAFDARTHRVTRQEAPGAPEVLTAALFRAVSFVVAADHLEVALEWVPEEALARPPTQQGEVLVVRVLIGLEADARARQHPGRIVNPTSKFNAVLLSR